MDSFLFQRDNNLMGDDLRAAHVLDVLRRVGRVLKHSLAVRVEKTPSFNSQSTALMRTDLEKSALCDVTNQNIIK